MHCNHHDDSFFPRISIAIISLRGYIYCIIFNTHHLWCIVYHYLHSCNIFTLDLDFKTSGKICPMIFLFVYASIHLNLITKKLQISLWCGILFTLAIFLAVYCISSWQCGKHIFQLTGRKFYHTRYHHQYSSYSPLIFL